MKKASFAFLLLPVLLLASCSNSSSRPSDYRGLYWLGDTGSNSELSESFIVERSNTEIVYSDPSSSPLDGNGVYYHLSLQGRDFEVSSIEIFMEGFSVYGITVETTIDEATSHLLKAGFHLTFSDELSNATYENDVISLELAYTHRIYLSLL